MSHNPTLGVRYDQDMSRAGAAALVDGMITSPDGQGAGRATGPVQTDHASRVYPPGNGAADESLLRTGVEKLSALLA